MGVENQNFLLIIGFIVIIALGATLIFVNTFNMQIKKYLCDLGFLTKTDAKKIFVEKDVLQEIREDLKEIKRNNTRIAEHLILKENPNCQDLISLFLRDNEGALK